MKTLLAGLFAFTGVVNFAHAQQDSTRRLNEVTIRPYFTTQTLIRSTGTIGLVDSATLAKQSGNSFVSSANTIPGVRMEERSPGSYRLSIRGSLLRSPFGIRNIKIYLDDFPLTDAGGNSYLNALDVAGASQLQILKGPQSSIYGANSGGVVLIQPQGSNVPTDSTSVALKLEGASFGGFHQNVLLQHQSGKYKLNVTQAYQQSDGYRDHSSMNRKYFQALQKWDYAKNANIKALIFYSDLHYNTPGGLTAAQYFQNPKLSRPAAGQTKSAIDQNAGIYSKTLYGGLSNNWIINGNLKHVISIFSSYTDFKNPFITNYEKRKEFTLGLRSYLEYTRSTSDVDWKFNLGLESMKTGTDFDNYDNNFGKTGAVQASDKLNANSNFAFAHLSIDVLQKLLVELSASANLYGYNYKSIAPVAIPKKTNKFDVQFMPRIALSYLLDDQLSIKTSVSKGYSPPSLAEVRASNNVINVDLQPEYGWNYESGISYVGLNKRLFLDVTGFYYNLKNAIVRRSISVNEKEAEYFTNAGGTKQWGIESSLAFWIIPLNNINFIKALQLRSSYTYSHFKFDQYFDKANNFSGNDLTGVPKMTIVSSTDLQLAQGFSVFLQHNYTSSIPLNDANTVYAKKYHLIQARIGKKGLKLANVPFELYIGADNLLNQKYSLGNDLNALGGRYFNASATRNFYGGLLICL
ncbi:TonB-dependent receptor [Pedobacter ginsengisoli]|uniref:TonB-dependent receptor n=1 Tax=Pedobacter ginsengisoli TaxID=363852 RepID=A0A2D1UBA1_9SPHI|nr:TonB-dependent receptor [Pedobacter ginsengisoli]ATP58900.1 TonB-dependent receptor [Pedobacter ginsengisoli]